MENKLGYISMNVTVKKEIITLQNQSLETNEEKDNISHNEINNKVIFDNSLPAVPTQNLKQLYQMAGQVLSDEISSDEEESEEEDNMKSGNDNNNHLNNSLVLRYQEEKSITPLPLNQEMTAEIKLLNLMTHHKMPLNAFQSIIGWAKEVSL